MLIADRFMIVTTFTNKVKHHNDGPIATVEGEGIDIAIRKWCVVENESKPYPGIITQTDEQTNRLHVLNGAQQVFLANDERLLLVEL